MRYKVKAEYGDDGFARFKVESDAGLAHATALALDRAFKLMPLMEFKGIHVTVEKEGSDA